MVARNIHTPNSYPPDSPDDFIRAIEELTQAANGGVEGGDAIFGLVGNSADVTLSGLLNYLTITGQVITMGPIDLTTDVTGDLPVAGGGTGAGTAPSAATNLGLGTGDNVVFTTADVGAGGYKVSGVKVVGAQQAAITSLTDSSTGTPAATIVAIGDTSTSNEGSSINDNFASLSAKIDALLAADRSHGLVAT